jgi:hypothetical protein
MLKAKEKTQSEEIEQIKSRYSIFEDHQKGIEKKEQIDT